MTSVISGSGLGLYDSSLTQANGFGAAGQPKVGNGNDLGYVNVATGNLIVQAQDDFVASMGLDTAIGRTYNSLGNFTDDNGDNWRVGPTRRLTGLSSAAGYTGNVSRLTADGHITIYTFDATSNGWKSTEGDGAHDRLARDPDNTSLWHWRDGSSGVTETYDGTGKLLYMRDRDGNATIYSYNASGFLTGIQDASGQSTQLIYSGNQLVQINSLRDDVTVTRVRYGYDSSNRLQTVKVDLLNPNDAAADAVANTYTTTYTYDGTSKRLASIIQSDGSYLGIIYVLVGAEYRIATLTDALSRQTRFTYFAASTQVTDPLGFVTTYQYDGQKRLVSVATPATNGALSARTEYAYDLDGNVSQVTSRRGDTAATAIRKVIYTYDANGNLTQTQDDAGNINLRTYNSANQLRNETVTALPSASAPVPLNFTSHWVRDAEQHVRFEVSQEGRVTEHRYDGPGNRITSIRYTANLYSSAAALGVGPETADLNALQSWVSALQTVATSQDIPIPTERTDFAYDFRGQIDRSTRFKSTKVSGEGVFDGNQSVVQYVYNAFGQLVNKVENPYGNAVRWQTDFNGDTAGGLPSGYTAYNNSGNFVVAKWGVTAKDIPTATGTPQVYPELVGNRTYAFSEAVTFRAEISTGPAATSASRLLYIGASNDAAGGTANYRRHMAIISGNTLYADWFDGSYRNTVLSSSLKDDATYVVEVVTGGISSVLYVYEKGKGRTTAFKHQLSIGAWSGGVRSSVFVHNGPGRAPASVTLDNFAEFSGFVEDGGYNPVKAETYSYDGLGRLLTLTDATGRVTTSQYDDANNKIVTTAQHGLVTTSIYDRTGQRLSTSSSGPGSVLLAKTSYFYDANGRLQRSEKTLTATAGDVAQNHFIYDQRGRLVGEVDGEKALTEYRYNDAGDLLKTIRYANRVTATLVGSPPPTSVQTIRPVLDAINDRVVQNVYDAAGRLTYVVDGEQYVTEQRYDSANRKSVTVAYATRLATALPDEPTAVDLATRVVVSTADRKSRNLYDGDGQLVGTLDGEGYLQERKYDASGRLTEVTAYATVTIEAARDNGTLDTLRPSSDGKDQRTVSYYNSAGEVVRTVDAEGNNTYYYYDAAGNKTGELQPQTTGGPSRFRAWLYDRLNRVVFEQNHETTLTVHNYDAASGFLTSTTRAAANAEARTSSFRYDALGRVLQEMNGEGSLALANAGSNASLQEAAWTKYATRRAYDLGGRLTSTTEGDTGRTTYFSAYDKQGRLLQSFNSAFETQNFGYNAFGEGIYQFRHSYFTPSDPDNRLTATAYDRRGLALSTVSTLGFTRANVYNAFGESVAQVWDTGSAPGVAYRTDTATYDKRGLKTQTIQDPTGVNARVSAVYDAFGRQIESRDALGRLSKSEYDRLGRVIITTDPLNGTRRSTYDAFDQVLTVTDALGNINQFQYSDADRSVTMTTAEGIVTVTKRNLHGQTITVKDGTDKITSYEYDRDGRLFKTTDANGNVTRSEYDVTGLVLKSIDARGIVTQFVYDAVGRVFTKTVDPGTGKLNLVTTYGYNVHGDVISVTDARRQVIDALGNTVTTTGVVTETVYDRDGRTVAVITDTGGTATSGNFLRLATVHTYDAQGNKLTVREGVKAVKTGSVWDFSAAATRTTGYTYDKLNRLTRQVLDPQVLALTTQYSYDVVGNLKLKIDPAGQETRYLYDDLNRLNYTEDAEHDVTETRYDAEGRITTRISYGTVIPALTNPGLSESQLMASRIALVSTDTSKDRVERMAYDKDGRLVYSVDALGAVTERQYDKANRVIATVCYAKYLPAGTAYTREGIAAAYNTAADPARDRLTRWVFDAAGRERFQVDAYNCIQEKKYDQAGNVVATTAYYFIPTLANGALTEAQVTSALVAVVNTAQDRTTLSAYDAANRLISITDATAKGVINLAGATEYYGYDGIGNRISFANKLGNIWTYGYDGAGRMVQETTPPVNVAVPVGSVDGGTVWAQTFASGLSGLQASPNSYSNYAVQEGKLQFNDRSDQATFTELVGQRTYARNQNVSFTAEVTTGNLPSNRRFYFGATSDPNAARYHNLFYIEGNQLGIFSDQNSVTANIATLGKNTTYVFEVTTSTGKTTYRYWLKSDPKFILGFREISTTQTGAVQMLLNSWTFSAVSPTVTDTVRVDNLQEQIAPSSEGGVANFTSPLTTQIVYDGLGNVVQRTEAVEFALFGQSRITRYVYDGIGRQVTTIHPQVGVYNGDLDQSLGYLGYQGRVETQQTLQSTTYYDRAGNAVAALDTGGRFSYKTYDAVGRLRYEVDAAGYLTSYSYDALGNQLSLKRYANRLFNGISIGAQGYSLSQMDAFAAALTSQQDRTISTSYDRLGRKLEVVEPAAYVFDSDAADNRYFTANPTTRYEYDAFGQAIKQSVLDNPNVGDTAARWKDTYSYYDRRGSKISQVDPLGYVTQWWIDAIGNNYRTLEFRDALTTPWSTAGASIPLPDDVAPLPVAGSSTPLWAQDFTSSATGLSPQASITAGTATTSYFNRNAGLLELRNQVNALSPGWVGVSGDRSYKLSDNLNLQYEFQISAVGNLQFALGLGQQDNYAAANQRGHYLQLKDGAVWFVAPGAVDGFAISSAELVATNPATTYVAEIETNASGSTIYLYVKGQSRTSGWSHRADFSGVDVSGLKARLHTYAQTNAADATAAQVLKIDAINERRVTPQLDTAVAQLAARTTRNVRETFITFDLLNRKNFEGLVGENISSVSGGVLTTKLPGYHYAGTFTNYDAVGNVANTGTYSQVQVDGTPPAVWQHNYQTFKYDALGRLIGKSGVARNTLNSSGFLVNQSPLTLIQYDAFGNQVAQTRYVNGATSDVSFTPTGTHSSDSVNYSFYDKLGRLVGQRDGEGTWQHSSYDAYGNRRKDWVNYTRNDGARAQKVTVYDYDQVGRQTATTEVLGESGGLASTQVRYDSFGQVTDRGFNNSFFEHFDYDNAGRLWRGNADDGIVKVHLYDLAGRMTAQIVSKDLDLSTYTSAEQVAQLTAGVRRTETVYDRLGRAVRQIQPTYTQNRGTDINPVFGISGGYPSVGQTVLIWAADAAEATLEADKGRIVTLRLRAAGTTDAFMERPVKVVAKPSAEQTTVYENYFAYDVTGFVEGNYDYELSYRWADESQPYALSKGTVQVGGGATIEQSSIYSFEEGTVNGRPALIISGKVGSTAGLTALDLIPPGSRNLVLRVPVVDLGDGRFAYTGWEGLRAGTYSFRPVGVVNTHVYTATRGSNTAAQSLRDRNAIIALWDGTVATEALPTNVQVTGFQYRSADSPAQWYDVPRDGNGDYALGQLPQRFEYRVVLKDGTGNSIDTTLLPGGSALSPGSVQRVYNGRWGAGQQNAGSSVILETVTPETRQTLDRWGNALTSTDVRGNVSSYRYDDANRVMSEQKAAVRIVGSDGRIVTAAPTTYYAYDGHGQLVGVVDGNGAAQLREYDGAGQLVAEVAGDGGRLTHTYDAMGREVRKTDGVGNNTVQSYDRNDRLVSMDRLGDDELAFNYGYDALGNRVREGHSTNTDTLTSIYDTRGNLIVSTWAGGANTYYSYDLRGRKISEDSSYSGMHQAWAYDDFKRIERMRNTDSSTTTYQYDRLNQKLSEKTYSVADSTGPGLGNPSGSTGLLAAFYGFRDPAQSPLYQLLPQYSRSYRYLDNGWMSGQSESGYQYTARNATVADHGRDTIWVYNAAGQAIRERSTWAFGESNLNGGQANRHTLYDIHSDYDTRGQIVRVRDIYESTLYGYDAASNRRFNQSVYRDTLASRQVQDYVFSYDRANRVVASLKGYYAPIAEAGNDGSTGSNTGSGGTYATSTSAYAPTAGSYLLRAEGQFLQYDRAGQRIRATTHKLKNDSDKLWLDGNSGQSGAFANRTSGQTLLQDLSLPEWYQKRESYGYDTAGRLRVVSGNGSGANNSTRTYDSNGRVRTQADNGGPTRTYGYDGNQRLQTVSQSGSTTTYAYDGATGVLNSVTTPGSGYTSTTTYNYQLQTNQYLEKSVVATTSNSPDGGPNVSISQYDHRGNRIYYRELNNYKNPTDATKRQDRLLDERRWVVDDMGRILQKREYEYEKPATPNAGQATAASNTLRAPTNDAAAFDDPNRYQWAAVGGTGTPLKQDKLRQTFYHYRSGGTVGSHDLITKDANTTPTVQPAEGDFDYNSTPITDQYPGLTPGLYTVNKGDTLQSIALSLYGDSSLWYVLADANGLKGNEALKEGMNLRLPNKVVNARNTADTFRPFNPADQIGQTSPQAPTAPPPPKKKCATFLTVLIVVVAIVATVLTAGALAPIAAMGIAGAVAAGAAAAAVGSIASQLVGMAVGMQSGFSWSAVGTAALSGAISGGVGAAVSSFGAAWSATAQAVVTNVGTQAVNIAIGQQEKFSWASLAASTAGGAFDDTFGGGTDAVKQATADKTKFSFQQFMKSDINWGRVGQQSFYNLSKGLVSRAVEIWAGGGGKMDYASIAADSFGQALGNEMVAIGQVKDEAATEVNKRRTIQQSIDDLRGGRQPSLLDKLNSEINGWQKLLGAKSSDKEDNLIRNFAESNQAERNGSSLTAGEDKDYDLLVSGPEKAKKPTASQQQAEQAKQEAEVLNDDPYAGMSAKEKAQARREAQNLARQEQLQQMQDEGRNAEEAQARMIAAGDAEGRGRSGRESATLGQMMGAAVVGFPESKGATFGKAGEIIYTMTPGTGLVDGVDGIRKGDLLLGGAMVLSETPVGKLGKLGKLARAGEGAGEAAADTARVASRGGDEAGQLAKQAADSSSATAAAGGKTTAKLGRAEIVTLLQRAAEKSVALAQRDVEMGRISSVKTVVGTRAHTYFEQEVKALGKQLESSGSRLRLKEEVFRKRGVGGMYGSVGGRRELGTKGLDAELRYVKANGKVVPIMGFDLKTGRGWTPGEMRIIRQHFGQMPIYQISVPTRKK